MVDGHDTHEVHWRDFSNRYEKNRGSTIECSTHLPQSAVY